MLFGGTVEVERLARLYLFDSRILLVIVASFTISTMYWSPVLVAPVAQR